MAEKDITAEELRAVGREHFDTDGQQLIDWAIGLADGSIQILHKYMGTDEDRAEMEKIPRQDFSRAVLMLGRDAKVDDVLRFARAFDAVRSAGRSSVLYLLREEADDDLHERLDDVERMLNEKDRRGAISPSNVRRNRK